MTHPCAHIHTQVSRSNRTRQAALEFGGQTISTYTQKQSTQTHAHTFASLYIITLAVNQDIPNFFKKFIPSYTKGVDDVFTMVGNGKFDTRLYLGPATSLTTAISLP